MKTYAKLFAFVCFATAGASHAQGVGPGDMWTQYAEKTGLFSPHEDHCATTEVFVAVGGGVLGFCIEKGERSAVTWEDAKEVCASLGKRLPEVAEFKYACSHPPTGLTNMTGNYEWASNSSIVLNDSSVRWGVVAPVFGGSACNDAGWGWIGRVIPSAYSDSIAYRCVK